MKKIIVNADDFGYRPEINKAIIYAHKNGIVKSTSMLVTRAGFDEAVVLAKENPELGIGLHIDLDKFFDIEHGKGFVKGWLNGYMPVKETIKTEVRKQIEKFLSIQIKPDHIDSHHHTHLNPEILPVILELCKEYGIDKIRFFDKFYKDKTVCDTMKTLLKQNDIKFPDCFIEGWYYGNVDEDYDICEIMTHPGYGEIWRETELAVCCDVILKEYCQKNNILIIKFSDL